MAPEQVKGLPLDARVDVFGLGIVLWELLCGRRPEEVRRNVALEKGGLAEEPSNLPAESNRARSPVCSQPPWSMVAAVASGLPR